MTPLVIFLLALATLFLGTIEAAFSAIMRLSLRFIAERSGRGDRLGECLEDPLRLFIPVRVLLGVAIVLVTLLLARETGVESAQAVATLAVGVILFVLVCEHLIPTLIVRHDPGRVLDILLPVFEPAARVVRPLTTTLAGWIAAERRDRAAEDAEEQAAVTGAEPESAPAEGGTLAEKDERALLQSIVDFGETLVREVMTPRPDIVAIRVDASLQDLRALMREQQYSRVPVYKETLDNIVGIAFVKDLVALDGGSGPPTVEGLMRPAYFVPESKRVPDLLKELQRRQVQLAIVVDEYGGTAGLVTVEDLLEEIVGEIRDEYDVESETVVDEGNGTFLFSGKVSVDEVADRLGVRIEREGFETVGGYLLSHLGRMPAPGELVDVDELSLQVLEIDRRRIGKVRVRRREPVATSEEEAR